MKNITLLYTLSLITLLCMSSSTLAQVGINTTDPKGILDINSATLGVVYPNVALIATDDPSPVVNPQGGAIVEGTVVYNTNSTDTNALTDVNPGIYVWDGGKWIIHFKKRQSELYNQTTLLRTEANFVGDWQDIPGLGISDANTFTAQYSGLYRVELKTNFGAGRTLNNSNVFASMASGQFRFLFDTNPARTFETQAYSAYSHDINGGTFFEALSKETYETYYVTLVAGTIYPFSLTFDAYDAPGFIGNGSTTTIPASVDLINEDFEDVAGVPYTVVQTNTTDPQCPAQGWQASTLNACPTCSGKTLNIYANNNTNCQQNATARLSFTPTVNRVNISFDYRFNERTGGSNNDSFRVYLHDGTAQVGQDIIFDENVNTNGFYNATFPIVSGTAHTLRFEYMNTGRGQWASVDNVVVSELSGPPGPSTNIGSGYVGNDLNCQIEFTYIGE